MLYRFLRHHPYFPPLFGPAILLLGGYLGGAFVWSGLLLNAFFAPAFYDIFGKEHEIDSVPKQKASWIFFVFLALVATNLATLSLLTSAGLSTLEFLGLALSMGAVLGPIGISFGHELIHMKNRIMQAAGVLCLIQLSLVHFRTAHVSWHHRMVGTTADPETARRGESVYKYIIRYFVQGWMVCFRINRKQALLLAMIQLLTWAGIAIFFGKLGLIAWAIQTVSGVMIALSVLYTQHYGLSRKEISPGRYEKISTEHSWDCDSKALNVFFFNTGHHSEHHMRAAPLVVELRAPPGPRCYPRSFSAYIPVTYLPSVWFRIAHPLLDKSAARD